MTINELLYGFAEPLPAQTRLKAGPLSMIYENGFIRYIKYGNNEIVRMIYMALRDQNWGTYAYTIKDEKVLAFSNSFIIKYTCLNKKADKIIFSWDVSIEGDETGRIVFEITGYAVADLLKNRAGFCILHPIKNTAGQPLTITYKNGSREHSFFPSSIAAKNPFPDIVKMQWQNEYQYVIEMEGESFEMEDHRNWTDASFKTFCTPLSLPFPVQLKAGEQIRQRICFYPLVTLPQVPATVTGDFVTITVNADKIQEMPAIGVGTSTETNTLSEIALNILQKINYDYYNIEICTSADNWLKHLQNEIYIGKQLHTSLFVTLELTSDYKKEFDEFAKLIEEHKQIVKYILIIEKDQPVTSQQIIEWTENHVKKVFPSALFGMGTSTNFAELNRNRRVLTDIDFTSYAIHPQEHAFDHLSMVENMESQADTINSARQIYPHASICISPVTLRRRINPYAQNKKERPCSNDQKADSRQDSLWAAGWVLGSIKYIGEAGAMAITYFQTIGKQGVCNNKGELYPIGSLLGMISGHKNAAVVQTTADEPLQCSSLLLQSGDINYLFLANHTNKPIRVHLPFSVTNIDKIEIFPSQIKSSGTPLSDIVELEPYEVVRAF